jgi:UDP-N-acetylmuramate--alanine ligase
MSGLARVALSLGARVSGSDRENSRLIEWLRSLGAKVTIGHRAEVVPGGAELIFSSSIHPDNPERVQARTLGLVERPRGELLAEVSRLRRCVAVAGTHGKTTTAAMIAHALRGAGEPVGYLIGGEPLDTGVNASWSESRWLVVETDESDRSLLAVRPEIAVLTNAEHEHVRTYRSQAEVEAVFSKFLSGADRVVADDVRWAAGREPNAVGVFAPEDVRLSAGGACFRWRGREVVLRVPGAHNAVNAAAALEACRLVGVDPQRAATALKSFPGTRRRLELIGRTASGAVVYEDYAHHPTEVAVTLEAARTLPHRRLVAVLEPHSHRRVAQMAPAFGEALSRADEIVLLDIRQAGPLDVPPVSSGLVAAAAAGLVSSERVAVPGSVEGARAHLTARLREGDLCVVMGISRRTQHLATGLVGPAPD